MLKFCCMVCNLATYAVLTEYIECQLQIEIGLNLFSLFICLQDCPISRACCIYWRESFRMVILLVTFFSMVLNYVQNVLSFVMWLETCIHIYIYIYVEFDICICCHINACGGGGICLYYANSNQ